MFGGFSLKSHFSIYVSNLCFRSQSVALSEDDFGIFGSLYNLICCSRQAEVSHLPVSLQTKDAEREFHVNPCFKRLPAQPVLLRVEQATVFGLSGRFLPKDT